MSALFPPCNHLLALIFDIGMIAVTEFVNAGLQRQREGRNQPNSRKQVKVNELNIIRNGYKKCLWK